MHSWRGIPIATSSCYHGITSVVMGNCGVTFAPCKPEDRQYLAELMESVEDIPRDAILGGLPWDWVTYGEYLASVDRMPKGLNVGGMVGHCALRQYAMGERGLDQAPPTADDLAVMADLLDEAMKAGALGFSTSRTYLHKVPDGRPVPGTYAQPDELFAFADVLGRHGAGIFESASRIGEGERDDADVPKTRAELAWMGEVSRRSGAPVSFGLTQHDSRPDLYARVIGFAKDENALGGDGASADHGAQRRHPVQHRHPHGVRSVRVVAVAARRCTTVARWSPFATRRSAPS